MGWRRRDGGGRSKKSKKPKKRGNRAAERERRERRHPYRQAHYGKVKWFSDAELMADNKAGTVRRFVLQCGLGKTFEEKLIAIAKAVNSFKTVNHDYETISDSWGNRTAFEIIHSKQFYALRGSLQSKRFKVEGCMDATTAFVAAARILAAEEKVVAQVFFVRWGVHSFVRVQFGGKNFLIDPGAFEGIREIKGMLASTLQSARKRMQYAEGFGPREIGLVSLNTFHRYAVE